MIQQRSLLDYLQSDDSNLIIISTEQPIISHETMIATINTNSSSSLSDRKGKRTATSSSSSASYKDEVQSIVDKTSNQLHLNTPNRRAIFTVLCQCRDVEDAYEKIITLQLGNMMDRDLVRVVFECVSREKEYNPFYLELLLLFIQQLPYAMKLSLEIFYYDELAAMLTWPLSADILPKKLERRCIHFARILAELVISFKLTLSVFKKLEISQLGNPYILIFLSTFFMCLFSHPSAKDSIEQVSDRLGKSKHFEHVRQLIIAFLSKYFKDFPPEMLSISNGNDQEMIEQVKFHRKKMLKIMKELEVLKHYVDTSPG
jgi:hypothetical protein